MQAKKKLVLFARVEPQIKEMLVALALAERRSITRQLEKLIEDAYSKL